MRHFLTLLILPVLLLLSGCCAFRGQCDTSKDAGADGPITHVVLVWLKPETTPEQRAAIEAGSRKLAALPGVEHLAVGRAVASDRPVVDDSFDLALSMQFADVAAMEAYIVHPDHQAYVNTLKPQVSRLQVYDFR